jgi:hypothetical protein
MDLISAYSILMGLGAAIGLWRILLSTRSLKHVLGGLVVLAGILAGARVGFVLLHPEYFSLHQEQAARFWLGGLSGVSGLWGGVLVCLLAQRWLRESLLRNMDEMSVFILPLTLANWIGIGLVSIMNGRSPFGRELSFALPTAFRNHLEVWTPVIIAVLFLVVLWMTEHLTRNSQTGKRGIWYLFIFSLLNLAASLVYPGNERILLKFKADVLLWLVSTVIYLFFLNFIYLYHPKESKIVKKSDSLEVDP